MNAGHTDTPALEIEALRFAHDAADGGAGDAWVVAVDRLTLARGQQLLLTGPSGEGKSTLLHVVAGLLEPQRGSVRVDGLDVHRLRGGQRDRYRGRHIGMIFQSLNLLRGFSAEQNVLLAMRFTPASAGERRRRAHDLLAQLGLDDPEAVVDRLSLGQQQRVAVARAVAAEPALVLADEPTASLDPARAAEAMTLIQRVCRDNHAALLCTSHDPAMAERFTQSVALADLATPPEAVA